MFKKIFGALIVLIGAFFLCLNFAVPRLAGNFYSLDLVEAKKNLSPETLNFIQSKVNEYKGQEIHDFHVHTVVHGLDPQLGYLNKSFHQILNPKYHILKKSYFSVLGVTEKTKVTEQTVKRLVDLARDIPFNYKAHIFAFDQVYNESGEAQKDQSFFYVSNQYIYGLSLKYPDLFVPVISIHPYRTDAITELEKWAGKGVKYLKWLPNAMGIDPLHEKSKAFFKVMAKTGVTLISHAGDESAVNSISQAYGNPLRLRAALDLGVQVIVAHVSLDGVGEDLDQPGAKLPNIDLFFRMFRDLKYKKLLFADISALYLRDRYKVAVSRAIQASHKESRFLYGSDYPIPAFNALVSIDALVSDKYLNATHGDYLKQIYRYNPLLFSLMLSMSLKDPETSLNYDHKVFRKAP